MMPVYVPGQQKNALCPTCESRELATFQYGVYEHQDGTKVPGVLILSCDRCHTQLAHAHQSSYLIQQARRQARPKKTSFRLPQVLMDLASSEVYQAGGNPIDLCAPELVLKATLASILDRPTLRRRLIERMKKVKGNPLLSQPASRKVSLRLSERAQDELAKLAEESHLKNSSEVFRISILIAAEEESSVTPELRKLVLLS